MRATQSWLGWMRKQQGQQATDNDSCCCGESCPNPDVAERQQAVNKACPENAADSDEELACIGIHERGCWETHGVAPNLSDRSWRAGWSVKGACEMPRNALSGDPVHERPRLQPWRDGPASWSFFCLA